METPLYFVTQVGFVVLTLIYFTLFVRELRTGVTLTSWDERRKKRYIAGWIIGLLVWGGFVSIWSFTGRMSAFENFPLNFFPVLVPPLLIILVITFTRATRDVLQHIPAENIVRLQSFRFFVEVLLWMLFIQNLMPVQMSFEGRNLDILSGVTAPVIAYLVSKRKLSRSGLIIWNVICLLLLINIVTIAILSTPTPLRMFFNEPANTIVTYFPISWLPAFLVPLAYTLHFFSLRQVLSEKPVAVKEAA
jgi:hypothetical protein